MESILQDIFNTHSTSLAFSNLKRNQPFARDCTMGGWTRALDQDLATHYFRVLILKRRPLTLPTTAVAAMSTTWGICPSTNFIACPVDLIHLFFFRQTVWLLTTAPKPPPSSKDPLSLLISRVCSASTKASPLSRWGDNAKGIQENM